MSLLKFKYTIVILFAIILGILALPQFHFTIGDKEFRFPDVSLSLIDSNSKLGNFKKSVGLYPSKEVKASIDFGTTPFNSDEKSVILNQYIDIINQRIAYSGLTDLKARGETNNSDYSIIITYPDYYTDKVTFTKWLTAQGKISFLNENGDSLNPLDIYDYDIDVSIGIDYLEKVGNHLVFKIKADKTTTLANALGSSSNSAIVMGIDDSPAYIVVAHSTLSGYVRAIANTTDANKNAYLYITRTYFLTDKPLEYKMNVASEEINVPSTYATDGGSILGIAFVLSAVALLIGAVSRYKFKGAVTFGLMLTSYISLIIVLLKLLSAPLSIATVFGFIIAYIIGVIVIWNILKLNPEESRSQFNKHLLFSGILLITTIAVYKLMPNLYIFNDLIGVLVIASLSLGLMVFFNFKELLKLQYSDMQLRTPSIKKPNLNRIRLKR